MSYVNVVAVFFFAIFIIYLYIKKHHAYWQRRKVPQVKSNSFLGEIGAILFNGIPRVNYYKHIYDELSPHKFGVVFNFLKPIIVLRDPELIKNVCTKDFDYFMDRSSGPLNQNDPLSANLLNLRGQQWKILRMKLSPTFTSGKIKNMFNLVKDCAQELQEIINKLTIDGESVEIKEMMSRYSTDVICSCAFGLESNSQKNSDSFLRNLGRNISTLNFRKVLVVLLEMTCPKLINITGLNFFESDIRENLKSIVTNTIKFREENNEVRNDFIDLLISLKKKEILSCEDDKNEEIKIEFTDDLLTAQCFIFFFAGFETASGVLAFALYELAKHEDYQTLLFNEIDKILEEDKELSYNSLQKMSYLEQVINETMRMYPSTHILTRICNKDYVIDDDVVIKKNTEVVVPVKGLHYDPQYYKNPHEFNPENFSKEAKDRRHQYVFLPFGEGPRICIGMRFGLMQVKLGLVTIFKNYAVSLSTKMDRSPKFSKFNFFHALEGGIWLRFDKRF